MLTFWIAYVLTRQLGASLGDFLTQLPNDGGLGLGTAVVSTLFLLVILGGIVTFSVRQWRAGRRAIAAGPSPLVA